MPNDKPQTTTTYGYTIKLCDGEISVSGCASVEEAIWKCRDLAKSCGYREPPVWKIWDQFTWVRS